MKGPVIVVNAQGREVGNAFTIPQAVRLAWRKGVRRRNPKFLYYEYEVKITGRRHAVVSGEGKERAVYAESRYADHVVKSMILPKCVRVS